ncbi:CpsB/CapC family capsule biosynthesis tyrosine phosphatase [Ornithinibacillus sp. FSL M8-0202]|uniref:tyrosine-protein phosphatase n=1 Tax=Ornithinibacillus sp. FSL M8-0202 TaxID=2921616 RepID=UPI0030D10DEF
MIDIHCHILPGFDHGPNTLAETIQMAKQAAKYGVNRIIATPYHQNDTFINAAGDIQIAVKYINEKLREEKIPVKILPGQEVQLYNGIVHDLKAGKIQTLADTQYVNVELPEDEIPLDMESIIYDIQLAGFVPVISNPELHPLIQENPNLLYRMIKNGALASFAAGSIIGAGGKKVQKLTEQLFKANLLHFIGSNAHVSKAYGKHFKEAIDRLTRMDRGVAYRLIQHNDSLIQGQTIEKYEPMRMNTSKWKLFRK